MASINGSIKKSIMTGILTSHNQDQRVVYNIKELEILDLPKLLTTLALSEEDIKNLSIRQLNQKYKEKGIYESKIIRMKLSNKRRRFKNCKNAKNKRDRATTEEAELIEGLRQMREDLARLPDLEETNETADFYQNQCQSFEDDYIKTGLICLDTDLSF